MYNKPARMIPQPEWSSDDEFANPKRLAWILLTDAIAKSILTNDITNEDKVLKSQDAIIDMIEAREWLVTDGGAAPITRDMCLTILNIKRHVVLTLLRHLWLRKSKSMSSTLGSIIVASRSAFSNQKRPSGKKHKHGMWRPENRVMVKLAYKGMDTIKTTNKMLGVV